MKCRFYNAFYKQFKWIGSRHKEIDGYYIYIYCFAAEVCAIAICGDFYWGFDKKFIIAISQFCARKKHI